MVLLSTQLRLLIRRLIRLYPLFLIAIGLIGFMALGIIMNRLDLAIRSLTLVIPLISVGVLLLIKKGPQRRLDEIIIGKWPRFSHLTMIYVITIIISIIILYVNKERPLEYFVLISLISGLIFLQILQSDNVVKSSIILIEILVLLLCLIWGVTLNYPLYYGWTDTLSHLYYIGTIIDTNHINGLGGNYINFPLFHILISISVRICNLTPQPALFLVMGLIWSIGVIVTYLIFRNLLKSIPLALTACLLFALNAEVIQYGIYPVTRSLGFIFFLYVILLLLPSYKNNLKQLALQIIFVIALILTHHFTALLATILFILLFIITNLIIKSPFEFRISGKFIVLFGAALLTYLIIFTDMFAKNMNILLSKLFSSSSTGAPTATEVSYDLLDSFIFVIANSYAGMIFFLSLLGIGCLLIKKRGGNQKVTFIVLIGLLSLPFYIPGLQYFSFAAEIFLLYRFKLLVAPFVVLTMAIGIIYILGWINKSNHSGIRSRKIATPLCVMIVLATTFFSMLSNGNSIDSSDLNYNMDDSRYFSVTEVSSLAFMQKKANHAIPLYSDYHVVRDRYHLNNFTSLKILSDGDTTNIQKGYVLLRINELIIRGTLEFSNGLYHIHEKPDHANIIYYLERESTIYDNSYVNLYSMDYLKTIN